MHFFLFFAINMSKSGSTKKFLLVGLAGLVVGFSLMILLNSFM